jgi:hypothetical protein
MNRIHRQLLFGFALSFLLLAPNLSFSQRQTGKLKTKIKPADAAVWVDGDFVGHADRFNGPGQALELSAGEHDIRVSLVYYEDYKTRVTVEPGKTTVVKSKLGPSDEKHPSPPFAKAKIRCKPEVNAAVLVNGRFVGHADEMNGPMQALLLWPGDHQIEIRHAGYKPFKTALHVDNLMTGKSIEVKAQLEPLRVAEYARR